MPKNLKTPKIPEEKKYQGVIDDGTREIPLVNKFGKLICNIYTATFEKDWALMKSVETELKKRINAIFDMDEADDIFAKRSPFSSVGGRFFCENVIEGIGNIITEAVEDELRLSAQRTSKYLEDIQPTAPEVSGDAGTATADA